MMCDVCCVLCVCAFEITEFSLGLPLASTDLPVVNGFYCNGENNNKI